MFSISKPFLSVSVTQQFNTTTSMGRLTLNWIPLRADSAENELAE
jgi:hypothetical protein